MKIMTTSTLAFAAAIAAACSIAADVPRMKMTTEIPESITTPATVQTRIGTLKFFDGYPDDATTQ